MSRADKAKPIPADPASVAREADRVAELAASAPYRRGIAQALANELQNVRGVFASALSDLRRATLNRDASVNGRDAYDRSHGKAIKAGARLKSIVPTDEKVLVPAWLPPPGQREQEMVEIGAPAVDLGGYRESKGNGPSGKGLPIIGPGSNVDPNWLTKATDWLGNK